MPGLPTGSRPPAPEVAPVEHQGVRYSQVVNGQARGLDQSTGYLVATDLETDKDLWTLKVYEVTTDPNLEQDVQRIYFKSMVLEPDGKSLLIEREFSGKFRVDLEKRSVSKVD